MYEILASGGAKSHKEDEKDAVFSVVCVFYDNRRTKVRFSCGKLTNGFKSAQRLDGGVTQAYILPRAAWDAPAQRAAMVDRIPFSHPAQVPALVTLLRRQSAINALLRSCLATAASECDSQS